MIETNVKALLRELEGGNPFGERVRLVAATKTRTAEEIRRAVDAGIEHIGENKVQEFREKNALIRGAERHFIGHLQTNKVKYLVGEVGLIHSVDRDELAAQIARHAQKKGVTQEILVQVNIGHEKSKGGYDPAVALDTALRLSEVAGLSLRGFMAMLPDTEDKSLLARLADEMRTLYDRARAQMEGIDTLSMGMSGDWRLCIAHGSNMIRLGTAIFGERDYTK